jgi:hypothetical protein
MAGHLVVMVEMRNAYNILVEGQILLGDLDIFRMIIVKLDYTNWGTSMKL